MPSLPSSLPLFWLLLLLLIRVIEMMPSLPSSLPLFWLLLLLLPQPQPLRFSLSLFFDRCILSFLLRCSSLFFCFSLGFKLAYTASFLRRVPRQVIRVWCIVVLCSCLGQLFAHTFGVEVFVFLLANHAVIVIVDTLHILHQFLLMFSS